jgi:hypothetical protein
MLVVHKWDFVKQICFKQKGQWIIILIFHGTEGVIFSLGMKIKQHQPTYIPVTRLFNT